MYRCLGAVHVPDARTVDRVLFLPHQDHRVPRVCPAAFPGTYVLQHEPGNSSINSLQNLGHLKYRICYVDNNLLC